MASIMGVIFIFILYIIIYYALKIMYRDVKDGRKKSYNKGNRYGLEITAIGGNQDLEQGSLMILYEAINIGRAEDNQIILSEPFVSAYHGKVYMKNNLLLLEDLKSTNGIYVNGSKIVEKIKLLPNDTIAIGNALFTVLKLDNE